MNLSAFPSLYLIADIYFMYAFDYRSVIELRASLAAYIRICTSLQASTSQRSPVDSSALLLLLKDVLYQATIYDIPYVCRRLERVLGDKLMKRMSPWGLVTECETFIAGRKHISYDIGGVSQLDYLDLYKWFIPTRQESYKLDFIGELELGRGKDDAGYDTFKDWYTKDFQSFVDYNIQDVEIVDALEDKLGLIDLSLTVAYDSKVNYDDIFSQVRVWDTLIANHLMQKNICVPPREEHSKETKYEGAYVKEPILGGHDWIVSFDINSLYPHIIIQYNISPEKIVGESSHGINVNKMLDMKVPLNYLKTEGACLTPNGAKFKNDSQGFLPEMMEKMYNERVIFKKRMIKAKQQYERTKNPKLIKEIARCHNIQWSKKIALNSAYGAVGNQYFRYYDVRQASGITTAGQFIIRFIEKKVNEYLNGILQTKDKVDYMLPIIAIELYTNRNKLKNLFSNIK